MRRRLATIVGAIETVEPLGGLSGSPVLRVRGAGGSVVVKGGARAAELEFYRVVAPLLSDRGVATPGVRWAGQAAGRRWLVLEDVARSLPRERWLADAEVLAVLARLHESEGLPALRSRDAYRPAWTASTTASALAALPSAEADHLAPPLTALAGAAGGLFAPRCPVSGDPNPTNWGLRDDGTLVLFDWERFGRGTPALDLAPTLPGLGTAADYHRVARRYLAAARNRGRSAEVLARDVGLAKAWTAVEFLAGATEGRVPDGPHLTWLREHFPPWVRALAQT